MLKKQTLAFIVVVGIGLTLSLVKARAQMGGGMMGGGMGGGMMGPGQSSQGNTLPGAEIFNANCSSCHPNGGNTITPNLPLTGAPQLADYDRFLSFIRHPILPNGSPGSMPPFPPERISNEQARNLYQYLESMERTPGLGGPQGQGTRGYGPGMKGQGYGYGGYGWGMGPGMGSRYGMGGFGSIIMLVFGVAVIVGIIFLVRWLVVSTGGSRHSGRSADSALEIVKRRYARGEINKEEFEEKKKDVA